MDISFNQPWQQSKVDLSQLDIITAALARTCQPGTAIGLNGGLGAGKTTFIQHLCAQLGVKDAVNSPSFGYLHTYQAAELSILHADLYRAVPVERIVPELLDVMMAQTHLMLIEWAHCWPEASDYLTGSLTFDVSLEGLRTFTYDVY